MPKKFYEIKTLCNKLVRFSLNSHTPKPNINVNGMVPTLVVGTVIGSTLILNIRLVCRGPTIKK
jgi:hypothetical protein